MVAAARVLAAGVLAFVSSVQAVGPQFLVPYCYDVDLTLKYNNDVFSGIADTYLQGALRFSDTHQSTTRFEIVEMPKLGTLGWNNSLAGKFVYSPVDVTRLTRTDNFTYRAVNEYGASNWAVVSIEFIHDNRSDGILKTLVGIALISTLCSLGGLIRVVILQLLLNPDRRFQGAFWQSLTFLAAPPMDAFVPERSAADFKHSMHASDEGTETTDNPIAPNAARIVEDTDEFT